MPQGSGVAVSGDVLPEGAAVAVLEVAPTQAPEKAPAAPIEPLDEAPKLSARIETLYLYRRRHFTDVAGDAAEQRALKTGPGVLKRIVISQPAGMNGVLVLRDGAPGAGKIICRIEGAAGAPVSLPLDVPFEKGLNYALTGAAPGSWLIVWE